MNEIFGEKTDTLTVITAELVAAYVSNNPVPAAELPALIARVHGAIAGLVSGTLTVGDRRDGAGRGREAGRGPDPQVGPARRHRQLHRRQDLQDAQAPPHQPRARPEGLPRPLRPAGRLPDGRPELRRAALRARQGHRPGPARCHGRARAPGQGRLNDGRSAAPGGRGPPSRLIRRRQCTGRRRTRPAPGVAAGDQPALPGDAPLRRVEIGQRIGDRRHQGPPGVAPRRPVIRAGDQLGLPEANLHRRFVRICVHRGPNPIRTFHEQSASAGAVQSPERPVFGSRWSAVDWSRKRQCRCGFTASTVRTATRW